MIQHETLKTIILGVIGSLIATAITAVCRYAYDHGIFLRIYLTALLVIYKAQQWTASLIKAIIDAAILLSLQLLRFCRLVGYALYLATSFVYFQFELAFGGLLKRKSVVPILALVLIAIQMQKIQMWEPDPRSSPSVQVVFEPYDSDDSNYESGNKTVHLKKAPPGTWSYRITHDWDSRSGGMEIFRNKKRVFVGGSQCFLTVFRFHEGEQAINETSDDLVSGELKTDDITGDGIPDLLLLSESEGSSGYREYSLISLGEEVEEIYSQHGCHCEVHFEDLDSDGIYEAIIEDLGLITGYIGAGIHPTGPISKVILKHDATGFHFATDLMRQPTPTDNEIYAEARKASRERRLEDRLTDDTYEYIIKLVYAGNGELARRFVQLVFSDALTDEKESYWRSIRGGILQTPYRKEIAALNKWEIEQYASAECTE